MTTNDAESDAGSRESLVDRSIAPFLREQTLWPVMLVLFAHVVLFMATALLDTLRTWSGFGLLALVVLIGGSLATLGVDLHRGRLGLTSRTLGVLWVLGVLLAWGADRSGLY